VASCDLACHSCKITKNFELRIVRWTKLSLERRTKQRELLLQEAGEVLAIFTGSGRTAKSAGAWNSQFEIRNSKFNYVNNF
jgi:hypothetical protein